MGVRKMTGLVLASLFGLVGLIGCGPQEASVRAGAESTRGAEPGDWVVPDELAEGLTPLAIRTAEDLRVLMAENGTAERVALVPDGTTWWVTITVDIPLTEADFDRPLEALPAPLDSLGPSIGWIGVSADSPKGNLGLSVDPADGSLRSHLDGSMIPVTTALPGEEPGEPTTWSVNNVRLTAISLPVVALDGASAAGEILARYGPDRIEFGFGGSKIMTLEEAMVGVANLAPPATSTDTPEPEDLPAIAVDETTGIPAAAVPPTGAVPTTGVPATNG